MNEKSELIPSQAQLWAIELDKCMDTSWKKIEAWRQRCADLYPHHAHAIVSSHDRKRLGTELWFNDGSRVGLYFEQPGKLFFDETLMDKEHRGARVEIGPTKVSDKNDLIVVEDRSRKS